MPPNLVYILADDMGYGDCSCLNPESKIRTEYIDRLATAGMTFKDAHASSAVCTPSRYSILTGRYNWRSRLKESVTMGYSPPVIEDDRMTVGSLLRTQGYATACIGKWHLGWDWAKSGPAEEDVDFTQPITRGPMHCGFDTFIGISASLDMPPYVYLRDDRATAVPDHRTERVDNGPVMWRAGPVAPDFQHENVLPRLIDEAEAWIDAQATAKTPFFLYFPLPAPHTPILPTASFQGRSGLNAYGDFCLQVDDVVGRIMECLERGGVADDTILIFTSDNGCSPRADFEALYALGHHPSHEFRGHKADIYEGGHRIPLVIRWPKAITAGATSDATVCLSDLLATCADILEVSLPEDAGEDSVSNLSLWRGEGVAQVREATVHSSIDGSFSLRRGRWKLEMCPGSGGWSHPRPGRDPDAHLPRVQLYDLEADLGERVNVYDQHPHVVTELQDLLTRYVRDGRSTPGAPQPNTGPEWWKQLWWMA